MPSRFRRAASARFGRWRATDLAEVVDLTADPSPLDRGGWWAIASTFEGTITGYRFDTVTDVPAPWADPAPSADRQPDGWRGPAVSAWRSSMDRDRYCAGVVSIRNRIAAGDVYQVNLCRMLSAGLTAATSMLAASPYRLANRLALGNPAPYAGVLDTGDDWVVSASPELFLQRDGRRLTSAPIKGTAADLESFADKDFPENIMITDLVRNDLGRIAVPGSVAVIGLLHRQQHPGLAHLVSTVQADLAPQLGWADILAATFPPGSVSGAPKVRALQVISDLEPVPRGVYCGAFGFVDADRCAARLAVGIRTFAKVGDQLLFGTGAGITWASDPIAEWQETELKAARLIALATGT